MLNIVHRPAATPGLQRFLDAQTNYYERAKREMQMGRKQSCWIWFIFPQILMGKIGISENHRRYAIDSLKEALDYLNHPILGARLVELTELVLTHRDSSSIDEIMGGALDAMKFRSSMTLFSLVSPQGSIFHQCIDHFFEGTSCPITTRKFGKTHLSSTFTTGAPERNRQREARTTWFV
jgi:uncharacterized protein (DUF1810 family)